MGRRFKLVCGSMGSGWPSGHVAVDHYYGWPDSAGGNEICLNHDTDSPDELISEINKLIFELEDLKEDVPKRFSQWKALFEKASKRELDG